MGFLDAFKAFFSSLSKIATYFTNKRLVDAGEDAERGKRAENALKDITHVKNTKKDVDSLNDEQLLDELRNPDQS